jgi:flagellar basal body-associated protein FliL
MPSLPQIKLKRTMLLGIASVLLLILSVGGFLYYQQLAQERKLAEIEANKLENKIIKARLYREKNPLDNYYVNLTTNYNNRIRVNVNDGKFRTYVIAEVIIKVQDAATRKSVREILPLIENKANILISAMPADDLRAVTGRNAIAQQLLLFANNLLDPEITNRYIKQFSADPTQQKDENNQSDSLPFEITAEDLPVQAVLFDAFMLTR